MIDVVERARRRPMAGRAVILRIAGNEMRTEYPQGCAQPWEVGVAKMHDPKRSLYVGCESVIQHAAQDR